MNAPLGTSATERLAARIEVVTERATLTDYVDRLRFSIEERVTAVEAAVGSLDDRRREINGLFASLRRTIQESEDSNLARRMVELETQTAELKDIISALRTEVREAVTYLGSTTHTRLSTLGGNIENLRYRTSNLEINAASVSERLGRYLNAWPMGSIRRLRRKIRRLPDAP